MRTFYTEHDFVIKDENPTEIINATLEFIGKKIPGTRNLIEKSLKSAKSDKKPIYNSTLDLYFVWDDIREEYNIIKKEFYEYSNIVYNLFDLTTEFFDGCDITAEIEERHSYIDKYLAEIETYEKLTLTNEKEMLKDLVMQMMTTLEVYNETELSEEEAESISNTIDTAFYSPITEILENLIEQISSNKIAVNVGKE
ncbi:MAG: hypothetical protein JXR63_09835 [Spirochaetales bacterium]|nr:hypothetical protein [Spirochaetales bacterium]